MVAQALAISSVEVLRESAGRFGLQPSAPAPYFKDNVSTVERDNRSESLRSDGGRVTGRIKVAKCRCGSVWCPDCCVSSGLRVRDRLQVELKYMKSVYFLTLSLDREKFPEGPEFAYRYIQEKRVIPEMVKELRRRRLLNDPRHFCVVEYQTKTGEGWPHWHVVLDATYIPFQTLCELWAQKAWSVERWGERPEFKGKGQRPVLGSVQFRCKGYENRARVVSYVTGYMTKAPKKTEEFPDRWPAWVLDCKYPIRRWSCSRDFWRYSEKPESRGDDGKSLALLREKYGPEEGEEWEESGDLELKPRRLVSGTVRSRVASCGEKSVVLREVAVRNHFTREWESFWEFVGVIPDDTWRKPELLRRDGSPFWGSACDVTKTSFVVFDPGEASLLLFCANGGP